MLCDYFEQNNEYSFSCISRIAKMSNGLNIQKFHVKEWIFLFLKFERIHNNFIFYFISGMFDWIDQLGLHTCKVIRF